MTDYDADADLEEALDNALNNYQLYDQAVRELRQLRQRCEELARDMDKAMVNVSLSTLGGNIVINSQRVRAMAKGES